VAAAAAATAGTLQPSSKPEQQQQPLEAIPLQQQQHTGLMQSPVGFGAPVNPLLQQQQQQQQPPPYARPAFPQQRAAEASAFFKSMFPAASISVSDGIPHAAGQLQGQQQQQQVDMVTGQSSGELAPGQPGLAAGLFASAGTAPSPQQMYNPLAGMFGGGSAPVQQQHQAVGGAEGTMPGLVLLRQLQGQLAQAQQHPHQLQSMGVAIPDPAVVSAGPAGVLYANVIICSPLPPLFPAVSWLVTEPCKSRALCLIVFKNMVCPVLACVHEYGLPCACLCSRIWSALCAAPSAVGTPANSAPLGIPPGFNRLQF
jgi:hypothetical protein